MEVAYKNPPDSETRALSHAKFFPVQLDRPMRFLVRSVRHRMPYDACARRKQKRSSADIHLVHVRISISPTWNARTAESRASAPESHADDDSLNSQNRLLRFARTSVQRHYLLDIRRALSNSVIRNMTPSFRLIVRRYRSAYRR